MNFRLAKHNPFSIRSPPSASLGESFWALSLQAPVDLSNGNCQVPILCQLNRCQPRFVRESIPQLSLVRGRLSCNGMSVRSQTCSQYKNWRRTLVVVVLRALPDLA
jgi:hypothetical protein